MKAISNADFDLALRLLSALSKTKGSTVREKENARKAAVLHRKLSKRNGVNQHTEINRQPAGLSGGEIFSPGSLD